MMSGLTGILFVYVLGGLTFVPLVVLSIFLHAYLTLPVREETELPTATLVRSGDDENLLQTARQTFGEKLQLHHESDASGWFVIAREWVPGGVNGKPPERSTPMGTTTVSVPSPSVYQTMYRSIFDRKAGGNTMDSKGSGKLPRRGGNVFYVVLRHGHIMLFDNEEQLEVRHVIALAHHDVSIYSGGDETPEGELFIKRNAIKLSYKNNSEQPPYFLYSENCSDKEDFYFVLRNQEVNPPKPLQYEVKDIITLVQRLHSSEEHLQTRWINALIGRVFLALYKTQEVEDFVRAKITKKISRVKTPAFLSKIALRNIDMGEAAPVITNPRLKDLTVDGELIVEADVRYSGSFSLQVAATARIELGSRFKAREVDLLLAVVLRRLEGHILIRIKPFPSNRFWMTFQTMPKIDMTIEPIVSSRQITYTLILRQIENRIKEVIAESLVYPNWDDSPFFNTEHKSYRGGLWAHASSSDVQNEVESPAKEGEADEVNDLEPGESILAVPQDDGTSSIASTDTASGSPYLRKGAKSVFNLTSPKANGSSTSIDTKSSASERLDKPKVLRAGSFATISSPVLSVDDAFKDSSPPHSSQGASAMAAMAALAESRSAPQTPEGSPETSRLGKADNVSIASSGSGHAAEKAAVDDTREVQSTGAAADPKRLSAVLPKDPKSPVRATMSGSVSPNSKGPLGQESRREDSSASSKTSTKSATETRKLSLAAMGSAAITAKNWGWNAIQRRAEQQKVDGSSDSAEISKEPLVFGRGMPLPPPGTPLPFPDKKTKTATAPIPIHKRKPMPPPILSQRRRTNSDQGEEHENRTPPPLPRRRQGADPVDDGLLVVSVPSEPTTPISEHAPSYIQPWVEDCEDGARDLPLSDLRSPKPPKLPKRKVISNNPEEDSHKLPSWLAAQEEEARGKSTLVDDDIGLQ